MNRGEIRTHVRDILGESGPYGFWSDDELNRYITLACDRHAQEALSAPAEVFTNSINEVTEYDMPPDYAEMLRVWYLDTNSQGRRQLPYVKKGTLQQYSDIQSVGEPRAYYIFNDKLGLYPAPYQPPIIAKNFETDSGEGLNFTNTRIFDESFTGGGEPYRFDFNIELETDVNDGVVISPAIAYVAHVGLYLRRIGPSVEGMFRIGFAREGYPNNLSLWKDLAGVSPIPNWIYFDFTENPIDLEAFADNFTMIFGTDQEYIDNVTGYEGGIEIGIDVDTVPFFELHPVRNDIIIEYYKNTVQILDDDNDIPEIPDRYHRTIVDMVIARACEKDGYNLALSARYHERASRAIRQARMQAKQATLGDQINTDAIAGRPDWTTYRDGKLVGRAW